MGVYKEYFELLCPLTQQVVREAHAVTPPDGIELRVDASSGILIEHEESGQWVSLHARRIGGVMKYNVCAGSLDIAVPGFIADDLQAIVKSIAEFIASHLLTERLRSL